MHILALGLNHRTAPVALRERLALDGDRLTAALASAHAEAGEAVILSTCNRTEVYAAVADIGNGARALRRVLAAQASGRAGEPADEQLESRRQAGQMAQAS